ncbi:hypothetical protein WCE41_08010 [Luteimonas sp. MJ246]|uniref:hypothetical protein n=1 Tax=Luteimonas sp. MJ174 TaxID=3129237 RepID=UPI0031BA30CF
MSADHTRNGFKERLPWTIAAIAVVALVASLVWDRPDKTDADATLAQLTERMDALESTPRTPARRAPVGIRPELAGGIGGDLGSGFGVGEPQTPEEIAAARDQQLKELEASFARDVPDPVSGPRTENLLVETISGDTMAGTGLRPGNVDIACKQSSCRIVGSFDSMGDAQDWGLFYVTAAGGNVLSQTRMVFVPKPGGKTEVRIYSERAKG